MIQSNIGELTHLAWCMEPYVDGIVAPRADQIAFWHRQVLGMMYDIENPPVQGDFMSKYVHKTYGIARAYDHAGNEIELTPAMADAFDRHLRASLRETVPVKNTHATDLANAIGAVRAKRRELRGESDACKLPIYLR